MQQIYKVVKNNIQWKLGKTQRENMECSRTYTACKRKPGVMISWEIWLYWQKSLKLYQEKLGIVEETLWRKRICHDGTVARTVVFGKKTCLCNSVMFLKWSWRKQCFQEMAVLLSICLVFHLCNYSTAILLHAPWNTEPLTKYFWREELKTRSPHTHTEWFSIKFDNRESI